LDAFEKDLRRFHPWFIRSDSGAISWLPWLPWLPRQVTPRQESLCAGLAAARPRSHRVKLGKDRAKKRANMFLNVFFMFFLCVYMLLKFSDVML